MRVVFHLCVAAICAAMAAGAQQPSPADLAKLGDSLGRLESNDLQLREIGFDDLMAVASSEVGPPSDPGIPGETLKKFLARHPDQADRIVLGLIHALTEANHLFITDKNVPDRNSPIGKYSEDDMEHYARLIDSVASLDDQKVIPALVGAITTGGMATGGLLKYGKSAFGPVMEQFKNGGPLTRSAALGTAVAILRESRDPASATQSVELLRSSLTDSEWLVREEAVMLLDCSEDRVNFVSVLEQLAKTDPVRYPGKTDGVDGNWRYPVRVQARRVLRDIHNNKVCPRQ